MFSLKPMRTRHNSVKHRFKKPMTARGLFASCSGRRFYVEPTFTRPDWTWKPGQPFVERQADDFKVTA